MYHDNIPVDAGVSIHTGFPNPAIDASLKDLDLNQLLIQNATATYLMRISGDAWQSQGIFNGDIVVIDRAITAQRNDIIAWWQDDSFAMSPLWQMPENATSWGTITSIIHQLKWGDS